MSLLSAHVVTLGIGGFRGSFAVGADATAVAAMLDDFPLLNFITASQTARPIDLVSWKTEVSATVKAAAGRVRYWQLGNELFIQSAQGDNWVGTPADYAATFTAFCEGVRAGDANAVPVTAGLCSGCIEGRGSGTEQLLRLAQQQGAGCDLHLYRGWESAASHISWARGIAGGEVVVTECGVTTAADVVKLFSVLYGAGVARVYYHSLTPVATDTPPFQEMALLENGQPSPRYYAVQTWNRVVGEGISSGTSLSNGISEYRFGNTRVLWAETIKSITLPVTAGYNVWRVAISGLEEKLRPHHNRVSLQVGPEPCYLMERK